MNLPLAVRENKSVPFFCFFFADFTLPPSTYKQMLEKYSKDFSGDAMYKKIIADAEDQLHRLSCFVAGTLVHTKEGLKPIEQIKVGDYVLSKPDRGGKIISAVEAATSSGLFKPESAEDEVSYKRVTRTFESESDDLHYVKYLGNDFVEFLVVTGNHPFWVINQDDSLTSSGMEAWVRPVNAWMRAGQLSEESNYTIMLHDGRKAEVNFVRRILRMDEPGFGWIADDACTENFMQGHVIDFRRDRPVYCHGQIAGAPSFVPLNIESYGGKTYDDYYEHPDSESAAPLCRKVYNLEVEDNHTYFVGEHGVWVHNTCAIENLKGENLFYTVKGYNAYVKANPGVENSLVFDTNKTQAQDKWWYQLQRDTDCKKAQKGTGSKRGHQKGDRFICFVSQTFL